MIAKPVVQVTYGLGVGGSEILARDILLWLKGSGYDCGICAIEKGGKLSEEFEKREIPYRVVYRKPDEYFSAAWRAFLFFRDVRPGVIHTHHLYQLVYSFLGAILVGAKIVHTEHEYFSLRGRKARQMLRFLSRFCAVITSVSDGVGDFLREEVGIDPKKLTTITNGVSIGRFAGPVSISKADCGLSEEDKIVGIVARLDKVKDHLTLLRAFREVVRRVEGCQLVVIGDGSERGNLERVSSEFGISDRVHFFGIRMDIPEMLSIMNVFVLSSIEEGLPISIIEAMASGIPVVATGVGSIPEVVQEHKTGFLVPPRDHLKMADRIVRLLEDDHLAVSLGENARAFVAENYNIDNSLRAYADIYFA